MQLYIIIKKAFCQYYFVHELVDVWEQFKEEVFEYYERLKHLEKDKVSI